MQIRNPEYYKRKIIAKNARIALKSIKLRKEEGWKSIWEIYKNGTINLTRKDLEELGKMIANIYRKMRIKYPEKYLPIARLYIVFEPRKEKPERGLINYYPPHFHQSIKNYIKMFKDIIIREKKEKVHH